MQRCSTRLGAALCVATLALSTAAGAQSPPETAPPDTPPPPAEPSSSDAPAEPGEPAGEPSPEDTKKRADALFQQGLDEMMAERYHTGCPALAESYKLDPVAGGVFTLAECEAKWGRYASALEHYREFLGLYLKMETTKRDRNEKRHGLATAQVAALETQVPRLTISLPANAPPGTKVRFDQQEIEAHRLGQQMMVNPGAHQIHTVLPNGETSETVVFLKDAEQRSLTLDVSGGDTADGEPDGPTPVSDAGGSGIDLRTGAYIAGGIGGAGLLLGIATGAAMLSQKGTLEDNCVGEACNAEGKEAADSAQTLGTVSSVGWIVGIAGIGAGVTMFILSLNEADDAQASASRIVPVFAGVADDPYAATFGVRGSW